MTTEAATPAALALDVLSDNIGHIVTIQVNSIQSVIDFIEEEVRKPVAGPRAAELIGALGGGLPAAQRRRRGPARQPVPEEPRRPLTPPCRPADRLDMQKRIEPPRYSTAGVRFVGRSASTAVPIPDQMK